MKKQTPEELKTIIQASIDEVNKLLQENIKALEDEVKALRNEYLKTYGHKCVYIASIDTLVQLHAN